MENNKKNSNIIAIVGFILSFFIGIAGLICSIIGLIKSKELKDGKAFSIAGIIISSLRIVLTIFIFILGMLVVISESKDVINDARSDIKEQIEENVDKNDTIIDTKSTKVEVFANNKNNIITFEYLTESFDNSIYSDEEIEIMKENEDYISSVTYVKVKINDNYVDDYKVLYRYNRGLTGEEYLTKENVEIIKGKDKDYFVLLVPEADQWTDGRTNPTFINEKGKKLYSIEYIANMGLWVEDENSIMYNKGKYFIDNDKFYFIKPYCNDIENIKAREYILTIDKDVANVKEGNIVKANGAGAIGC